MKDQAGIFYYPVPANKKFKMYVRSNQDIIEFRLHSDDDPKLWQEHGWITFQMAKEAAEIYKRQGKRNPMDLYDLEAAIHALEDAQK